MGIILAGMGEMDEDGFVEPEGQELDEVPLRERHTCFVGAKEQYRKDRDHNSLGKRI